MNHASVGSLLLLHDDKAMGTMVNAPIVIVKQRRGTKVDRIRTTTQLVTQEPALKVTSTSFVFQQPALVFRKGKVYEIRTVSIHRLT